MAKHNRNQTRKMFARELGSAIRDKAKKQRKAISPEGLNQRFEHLVKNPYDQEAISNYKKAFTSLFFSAKGSTAAQMCNLLNIQLGILTAQTEDSLQWLSKQLSKLRHKEVRR